MRSKLEPTVKDRGRAKALSFRLQGMSLKCPKAFDPQTTETIRMKSNVESIFIDSPDPIPKRQCCTPLRGEASSAPFRQRRLGGLEPSSLAWRIPIPDGLSISHPSQMSRGRKETWWRKSFWRQGLPQSSCLSSGNHVHSMIYAQHFFTVKRREFWIKEQNT